MKLKIKNVGPIKNGFGEEFMEFDGLTLFIGNQGTGKSTIAKIFSTLCWIEKALVREDFTGSYLSQYNRFKKQLAYQNIGNYITDESIIEYKGTAFNISYKNNKLEIVPLIDGDDFNFPKIMYVPAERNFVSTVDRPDLVKRLPLPLYTFLEEYEVAKQNIHESIELPIGNLKFEYRKQNKKSLLVGDNYRIDLLEASSGFQSLVPLFLVTRNLSRIISNDHNFNRKERSVDQEKKIRLEIDKIISNKNISEDIRNILLEKLSSKFTYNCFINIVEEPEQNLYPTSQKEILYELIESRNEVEFNKLVITTHSPYIINFLTLAIKADNVKEKIKEDSLLNALKEIVPLKSTIKSTMVNIYQIDEHGHISKLSNYNGLPSDENFLNEFLADFNEDFVKLLEIENKCQ